MVLEDCTGQPVAGFRLSDGWLRGSDLSFLEEVRDAGYLYDSSLLPRRREFHGDPASRTIVSHALRNGLLLEIPPSTLPVAGSWLPISGGNYQRQFPHRLMRSAVARWMETESAPFVMYFQVWELDSEQPRMSVPGRLTQVRHYRTLGKYRWLLPEYLQAWRFVSVRDHAGLPGSPLAEIRARHGTWCARCCSGAPVAQVGADARKSGNRGRWSGSCRIRHGSCLALQAWDPTFRAGKVRRIER